MKQLASIPTVAPEGQVWIGLGSVMGAGSWVRERDLGDVLRRLPKQFRSDFSRLGCTKDTEITFAAFLVNDVDCDLENGNVIPTDGSEQHMAIKFTQAKANAACIPTHIWDKE